MRRRVEQASALDVVSDGEESLFAVDSFFKAPEKGLRIAVSKTGIWLR
jgi:hypothetical protein